MMMKFKIFGFLFLGMIGYAQPSQAVSNSTGADVPSVCQSCTKGKINESEAATPFIQPAAIGVVDANGNAIKADDKTPPPANP
jgi:hypothetical protein